MDEKRIDEHKIFISHQELIDTPWGLLLKKKKIPVFDTDYHIETDYHLAECRNERRGIEVRWWRKV